MPNDTKSKMYLSDFEHVEEGIRLKNGLKNCLDNLLVCYVPNLIICECFFVSGLVTDYRVRLVIIIIFVVVVVGMSSQVYGRRRFLNLLCS